MPEHIRDGRFGEWLREAKDWNLSRERYWGAPLPIWECKKCDHTEVVGGLDELSRLAGGSKNNYWVMRHGEAESNVFNIIDSGQRKNLHLTPRGTETGARFDHAIQGRTFEEKNKARYDRGVGCDADPRDGKDRYVGLRWRKSVA